MWKETAFVRLWSLAKVPMIWYLRPKVVQADEETVVIRIKLRRRSKNHLGSMYFGALAVGADLAAGYHAMTAIQRSGQRVSFVFRSNEGAFLRRPTGHVHFTSAHGRAIQDALAQTLASGERVDVDVPVVATVPKEGDDPVATFTMVLSMRAKSGKKEEGTAKAA